jgi:hypothetical protein
MVRSSLEHTRPLTPMPTSTSTPAARRSLCRDLLSGLAELAAVAVALHPPLLPRKRPLPRPPHLLRPSPLLCQPFAFLSQLLLRLRAVRLAVRRSTDSAAETASLELSAARQALAKLPTPGTRNVSTRSVWRFSILHGCARDHSHAVAQRSDRLQQ